jgi:hypothetical protein
MSEEGTQMRRTSAILVIFLCIAVGCRGSEAQVPRDAAVRVAEGPLSAPPIISELHAPWAIALLSDAPERPRKRSGKVVVVEAGPEVEAPADPIMHESADVQVAFDDNVDQPEPRRVKDTPAKSCSGVVNRRS